MYIKFDNWMHAVYTCSSVKVAWAYSTHAGVIDEAAEFMKALTTSKALQKEFLAVVKKSGTDLIKLSKEVNKSSNQIWKVGFLFSFPHMHIHAHTAACIAGEASEPVRGGREWDLLPRAARPPLPSLSSKTGSAEGSIHCHWVLQRWV